MKPSCDNPSPPKRRRFSADNPFHDTDDTDTSYEAPPEKNNLCLESKPTKNPPNKFLSVARTQQDTSPDTDEFANEITFTGAFDDFSVHANERSKLATDYQKVMTQFKGDSNSDVDGIEEIKQTFQDLRRFNDVIYLYVRFARQQPASNFNTDSLHSSVLPNKPISSHMFFLLK